MEDRRSGKEVLRRQRDAKDDGSRRRASSRVKANKEDSLKSMVGRMHSIPAYVTLDVWHEARADATSVFISDLIICG